jgi:hypothetical protein
MPGLLAATRLVIFLSEGVDGLARRASPSTPSLTRGASAAGARSPGRSVSQERERSFGNFGRTHNISVVDTSILYSGRKESQPVYSGKRLINEAECPHLCQETKDSSQAQSPISTEVTLTPSNTSRL